MFIAAVLALLERLLFTLLLRLLKCCPKRADCGGSMVVAVAGVGVVGCELCEQRLLIMLGAPAVPSGWYCYAVFAVTAPHWPPEG